MYTKKSILVKTILKNLKQKKAKHILSGYACNLICSLDTTKTKLDSGRGEDSTEMTCKKFKDYVMEIISYEEKEMIPLTDEENKSYEKQNVYHICKKKFCNDKNEKSEFELYHKVRDHCHYTSKFRVAAHNICHLRYKTPKEIPVVAHNAAYDHHFIIKQVVKEFEGQFECFFSAN